MPPNDGQVFFKDRLETGTTLPTISHQDNTRAVSAIPSHAAEDYAAASPIDIIIYASVSSEVQLTAGAGNNAKASAASGSNVINFSNYKGVGVNAGIPPMVLPGP